MEADERLRREYGLTIKYVEDGQRMRMLVKKVSKRTTRRRKLMKEILGGSCQPLHVVKIEQAPRPLASSRGKVPIPDKQRKYCRWAKPCPLAEPLVHYAEALANKRRAGFHGSSDCGVGG